MKVISAQLVLQQFRTLNVPLNADIKSLRHARNKLLHSLYEKAKTAKDESESLAVDKEIAKVQNAYFFLKNHINDIHLQLNAISEMKEKYDVLNLPMTASIDDVRHRRNELLHNLSLQENLQNLPYFDKQIHEIQKAYLFIIENHKLFKFH
jgi:hypothetical protein